ncbi:DNA-binding HxlR family transcriptional regulator [Actinoplanes lutulentus]|uniref:HxlR family transcriptional regulator n=1 Tax=Actinoplanes lutulentus TaxID=1287878 RepID=A0A327ZKS8_9ACTN|nr:helix-turn-helix domain-containing protein [Actinoplanes lutulentus]MBB2940562.1 DNA-binding HxlR family transcriptional regulator [Actinoplanes lutulentus]RAK42875.1 HxlR family transcriptional regulator [Actinoplanes lutulentus]
MRTTSSVLELITSRWVVQILLALDGRRHRRFTELHKQIPGIGPSMLSSRLRELERRGLVTRSYHAEIPPRTEYDLTELGDSLLPALNALQDWAQRHGDDVRWPSSFC